MMPQQSLPIGTEYQSMQDAIDSLQRLEQAFLERRDRRGIFVTSYLQFTRSLRDWVEAQRFHDNAWVARCAVVFANLYRKALVTYEAGDRSAVPEAWQIALDTSAAGVGLTIQDLVLGINAHINYDLPFALAEVGIGPDRAMRYADHTAINDALQAAIDIVQERIATLYASGLGVLDHLVGNLDESFTSFSLHTAREHAWNMATALVNAQTDTERDFHSRAIGRQSVLIARLILAPNTPFPWLIEALRAVERLRPWWELLAATPETATVATRSFVILGSNLSTEAASFAALPSSMDDILARLQELIARFNQERNRLSVHATLYQRMTRRVKVTLETGGFQDPAWVTQIELRFAGRYFATLALYLAGRTDQLPRCWAFAFETMHTGQTMIVQDLALQLAPWVLYDLPITLQEVELDANLEKYVQDYEKLYALLISELDTIQNILTRKYRQFVPFEDALSARLCEMLTEMFYTHTRQKTWDNALALHNTPSEEQRPMLQQHLNRQAVNAANKALFWEAPSVTWMCQAVRTLEDNFSTNWSELLEEPVIP